MRSFGWMWMLGAAATLAIGCGSGGTNEVYLVGANHGEDPGPKGVSNKLGGSTAPTATVGTLAALCVQACAHLRAADCKNEPAYKVTECPGECGSGGAPSGTKAPECDDELITYYKCVIGAAVECSSAGQPKVSCTDQNDAYESCVSHGGGGGYPGCIAQTQSNSICAQYFNQPTYTYYQCSSPYTPDPSCLMVGGNAFCCP